MSSHQEFVIDFVARSETPHEWRLVLVEQGPWSDVTPELLRLQDRLYNCIDAVLDGQVAAEFPETKSARIVIRLDCYDVPEAEVTEFFRKFSEGVFQIGDYQDALKQSEYTTGITFAINFDHVHRSIDV